MRCAIYTRKSHTEGLEQPFNSLDAQRLACSHYISSEASEGWSELEGRYDDLLSNTPAEHRDFVLDRARSACKLCSSSSVARVPPTC